jgi:hypothetical protein
MDLQVLQVLQAPLVLLELPEPLVRPAHHLPLRALLVLPEPQEPQVLPAQPVLEGQAVKVTDCLTMEQQDLLAEPEVQEVQEVLAGLEAQEVPGVQAEQEVREVMELQEVLVVQALQEAQVPRAVLAVLLFKQTLTLMYDFC